MDITPQAIPYAVLRRYGFDVIHHDESHGTVVGALDAQDRVQIVGPAGNIYIDSDLPPFGPRWRKFVDNVRDVHASGTGEVLSQVLPAMGRLALVVHAGETVAVTDRMYRKGARGDEFTIYRVVQNQVVSAQVYSHVNREGRPLRYYELGEDMPSSIRLIDLQRGVRVSHLYHADSVLERNTWNWGASAASDLRPLFAGVEDHPKVPARPVRLKPWRGGWEFIVHGLPVRVYGEAAWNGVAPMDNASIAGQMYRALQRYPAPLLKIVRRYLRERYGEARLHIHLVDLPRLKKNTAHATRVLRARGMREMFYRAAIFGKVLLEQRTDLRRDPAAVRRHVDKLEQELGGQFSGRTGRIALFVRAPQADVVNTITHEFGHLIEVMLGNEFIAEWKQLHAHYMQAAAADVDKSAALIATDGSIPSEPTDTQKKLVTQLIERGWIPRAYAAHSAREFFAELCANAFGDAEALWSTEKKQVLAQDSHFSRLAQSLHRAFAQARSASQLRRLIREVIL